MMHVQKEKNAKVRYLLKQNNQLPEVAHFFLKIRETCCCEKSSTAALLQIGAHRFLNSLFHYLWAC